MSVHDKKNLAIRAMHFWVCFKKKFCGSWPGVDVLGALSVLSPPPSPSPSPSSPQASSGRALPLLERESSCFSSPGAFPESSSAPLQHSQPSSSTQCFGGSWLHPKPAALPRPCRADCGCSVADPCGEWHLDHFWKHAQGSQPCQQNTDRPFRTQPAVLNSFVLPPFMVLHRTWDVRIPGNVSTWKETHVGNITHASAAVGAVPGYWGTLSVLEQTMKFL